MSRYGGGRRSARGAGSMAHIPVPARGPTRRPAGHSRCRSCRRVCERRGRSVTPAADCALDRTAGAAGSCSEEKPAGAVALSGSTVYDVGPATRSRERSITSCINCVARCINAFWRGAWSEPRLDTSAEAMASASGPSTNNVIICDNGTGVRARPRQARRQLLSAGRLARSLSKPASPERTSRATSSPRWWVGRCCARRRKPSAMLR